MSTLRNRVTVPIAIALALVITPALSGCFGNPIESLIEVGRPAATSTSAAPACPTATRAARCPSSTARSSSAG